MSRVVFLDFDEGPLQGAMDISCELKHLNSKSLSNSFLTLIKVLISN